MATQTVFDPGDLITSRLTLGVTPDGTTSATVVVYRPDGVALTGLNTTAWAGDQKTVQWYATDDGTAAGTLTHAVGDWLAVWTVTGTGASVSPKIYPVTRLPRVGVRPDWSPLLSEVADHVPYLTVDAVTPGSQTYLGTFTGATVPTDEQAQRHLDAAVRQVGALLGSLPTGLWPMAASVAALRAASTLARAFPRNRSDIATADQLAAQAKADLAVLATAAEVAGSSPASSPLPVLYAPDPNWWGDLNL